MLTKKPDLRKLWAQCFRQAEAELGKSAAIHLIARKADELYGRHLRIFEHQFGDRPITTNECDK